MKIVVQDESAERFSEHHQLSFDRLDCLNRVNPKAKAENWEPLRGFRGVWSEAACSCFSSQAVPPENNISPQLPRKHKENVWL